MMNKRASIAVAAATCLAMSGVAGCASSATTTLQNSDETNASGITQGAYLQAASLVADNDSYEVQTPSESEISDIYTFTLEGETYTLPCKASEFASAGWTAKRAGKLDAGEYYDAPAAKGFVLKSNKNKEVGLIIVNEGSKSASWKDCTVVGVMADDAVELTTAAGISAGSSFADVQAAYGATRYTTDRFGTLGYHFYGASDESADAHNWYGQAKDTLTFTADNTGLYPEWESEGTVLTIRMENFGTIAATESDSE